MIRSFRSLVARAAAAPAALVGGALVLSLSAAGCGNAQVVRSDGDGDGVTGGAGTGGGPRGGGDAAGGLDVGGGDATGGSGQGGGSPNDPCTGLVCPRDQSCQLVDGAAECVPNDCATLECDSTQECVPTSDGAVCESLVCDADVECAPERFCDDATNQCTDDVCTPGERSCDGADVVECRGNGGGTKVVSTCGATASGFTATCTAVGGTAGCDCTDDWDCGEYLRCENQICIGTGEEPTCRLPPASFSEVLPGPEIEWMADAVDGSGDPLAPYPTSRHVGMTPIVANLDDDNGDGRIDERDFPEIVFLTYVDDGGHPGRGVLRAIHAGGPAKGQSYFAVCGDPADDSGTGQLERWLEGDDPADFDCDAGSDDAILRPGGIPAVGDLDGDGVPEIVVATRFGSVLVLDNAGALLLETTRGEWPASNTTWKYPGLALANLDQAGLVEIIIGDHVVVLGQDDEGNLVEEVVLEGGEHTGAQQFGSEVEHFGPAVCVADIAGGSQPELVAGTSVYRLPARPDDCDGDNATTAWCQGELELVWDGVTVNGTDDTDDGFAGPGSPRGIDAEERFHEGFCAVADVLGEDRTAAPGVDNPLDGVPEVVLIANGVLLVFDGELGTLLYREELGGGTLGGAPNIDDFDGDGFPEIATALADFYTVVDLQEATTSCPTWTVQVADDVEPPGANPPRDPGGACTDDGDCNEGATCRIAAGDTDGTCACDHNSWRRDTEDNSSRATSSSVFDFNGDGLAEVVYNDECYLRVYDGATSGLLFKRPSLSRTFMENAIVADVDNDGNAEIVTVNNTETVQCSEGTLEWPEGDGTMTMDAGDFEPGIKVWGDASDRWVSARRVWNQHSYHVTNVTEGGAIPTVEADSWLSYGGREFNTYRSQPRSFGVAPDLAVTAVQLSTPASGCGTGPSDVMTIAVQITNEGDLRVGPGVRVVFEATFGDGAPVLLVDAEGDVLEKVIETSLEPRGTLFFEVEYEAGQNPGESGLPSAVRVIVDPETDDSAEGAALECDEDNNSLEETLSLVTDERAELSASVGAPAGCPTPQVSVTVNNTGSVDADDVVVQLYVGDPQAGGTLLAEKTIKNPIAAGGSATIQFTADGFPQGVPARLYAVIDPENDVQECSDANNVGGPSAALECPRILR